MRHSRFTYINAYHHVMNRGDKGEDIFGKDTLKSQFLELVQEKSKIYKIKIFAYCIMDNHFHLVLQNTSGKISDMMRVLDGQYAINYRATGTRNERGYVFQGRYTSTLISDDRYLKMAIIYVLLNPTKANIVKNPYDYRWSSINEYFTNDISDIVDNNFVENIFGDKESFNNMLKEWSNKEDLPVKETRLGKILGDDRFMIDAIKKFNRREKRGESKRMREDKFEFETPDILIKRFEQKKGVKLNNIDYCSKEGKIIRYEILRILKEQGGLSYKEIIKYKPFENLKFSSLGQIYKRGKEKNKI